MANLSIGKGNAKSTFEIMKKAENVKPIAIKNGMKIVPFEDGLVLTEMEILDGNVDMGERKMNPDGSIARSKKKVACINLDMLFNNRYRKVKGKKIQVVTDYRALSNLQDGRIYASRVTCYEISKDDNGELKLDKITSVSDDEFVSDFTHKLDKQSMVQILSLIDQGKNEDITEDTLSF